MTPRLQIIILCIVTSMFASSGATASKTASATVSKTASASASKSADDAEIASFMDDFQNTIKSRWKPPAIKRSTHPIVKFFINPDGRITDSSMLVGSGDAAFDAACIRTVEQSSPLTNVPRAIKDKTPVQFDFAYNFHPTKSRHRQRTGFFDDPSWWLLIPLVAVVGWKLWAYARFFSGFITNKLPAENVMKSPLSNSAARNEVPLPTLDKDVASKHDLLRFGIMAGIGLLLLGSGIADSFLYPFGQFIDGWNHRLDGQMLILQLWIVPERSVYIVLGIMLLALANPASFGLTRYVAYGLELAKRQAPNTALVTFAKDPYHPMQARVESFTDGSPVAMKHVKLFGYGYLPGELPFSDYAEVFFEPETQNPVLFKVGAACLFVRGSSAARKAMFCPWLLK